MNKIKQIAPGNTLIADLNIELDNITRSAQDKIVYQEDGRISKKQLTLIINKNTNTGVYTLLLKGDEVTKSIQFS